MIETILLFVVVMIFLVISHELGHFFFAKWFGVRVDEFGVGLPPRAWGIKFGETLYSLDWLPFGGFVKIFGEDEDVGDPRSFSSQKTYRKTLIVVAGVLANILVGASIFSFLAWYGTPRFAVEIVEVSSGSPAQKAGLLAGDLVTGFVGSKSGDISVNDVQQYISKLNGEHAFFAVQRNGEAFVVDVVPRVEVPQGEGPLGVVIAQKEVGLVRAPLWRAPIDGVQKTIFVLKELAGGIVFFFRELFSVGSAPGEVLGPVGIAGVARASFDVGARYFLELIAFLSLNLAIINILPIPALDGGRILFFGIEKVTGKKIPSRVAGVIHSLFFMLLIALLLWITYQDVLRLL